MQKPLPEACVVVVVVAVVVVVGASVTVGASVGLSGPRVGGRGTSKGNKKTF